jgi:O-antigen ligase
MTRFPSAMPERISLGRNLIPALTALGLVVTALSHGGYPPGFRAAATIAVWWLAMLAIVFSRGGPPLRRATIATGLVLVAYAGLALASLLWADDPGRGFGDVVTAGGYLGVFVLCALAVRADGPSSVLTGITLGLAAVLVLALASRLVPAAFPENPLPVFLPDVSGRLSYPVGYWNGLAACFALLWVLLLGWQAEQLARASRAIAAAFLPATVLGLFLTSSRGGMLASALGTLVLALASRHRLRVTVVAVCGLAGGIVLSLLAHAHDDLLPNAEGRLQGAGALESIVAIVVVGGVVAGLVWLYDTPTVRERRTPLVRRGAVTAVLAVAVVAGLVLGLLRLDLQAAWDEFSKPPPTTGSAEGFATRHLREAGSGGRVQLWEAAVDAFNSQPLAGLGIGGYEAWWRAHGSLGLKARDAHSLFLEAAAELGVAGLLLALAFFALALRAAIGARARSPGAATAAAALVVGLVSAAIDWTWELPAAFVPVIAIAAVAVAAGAPPRKPAAGYALGVATLLVGWVIVIASAVLLVSEARLAASQRYASHGELERAADAARAAAAVEPWAAAPRLQLALVRERQGLGAAALAANAQARQRAPNDWQLWVVEARLRTRRGQLSAARRALDRARDLSPRNPILQRH